MNKHCILVVDDNATNLKLIAEVMECEGHRVIRAQDAEHAQVLLTSIIPDLILMDIGLPGMDGLTFTRILKGDNRTAHVPIVALTSFAMKGDNLKAREAGCDGYITKPIDTRTICSTVSQFLPQTPST